MMRDALSKEDVPSECTACPCATITTSRCGCRPREAVASRVPEGASVALVGHFKDSSSSYLARFPAGS